jgi:hypothetical protein
VRACDCGRGGKYFLDVRFGENGPGRLMDHALRRPGPEILVGTMDALVGMKCAIFMCIVRALLALLSGDGNYQ